MLGCDSVPGLVVNVVLRDHSAFERGSAEPMTRCHIPDDRHPP